MRRFPPQLAAVLAITIVLAVAAPAPPGRAAEPAETPLGRATALLDAGRPAEALALLEPLVATAAPDPQVATVAARAALALGRQREAERWLRAAVARAPVSPAARLLGEVALRAGRHAEAYDLLRPWADAHRDDQGALLGAIFSAIGTGDAARLAAARELAARLPAGDPRTVLLTGRILRLQRSPEAAPALAPLVAGPGAEALAARDPGLAADVALEHARALLDAGKTAEAVPSLERATRLAPANEPAWRALGEALIEAGRVDEAYAALQRAQALVEERARTLADERAAAEQRSASPPDPR